MASKKHALLIGEIPRCYHIWGSFNDFAVLHEYQTGNREEFLRSCRDGLYDKVYAICRSNESVKVTGPFDTEMIAALPESVKFICHNGAGYDNIDIPACTARNISVSHTPRAGNAATADLAAFLMIGALRRISVQLNACRQGKWRGSSDMGHDPRGKVLGIFGMGGIGRALAERAMTFGMKIIYHNRNPLAEYQAARAKYVHFDELIAEADVISLNLPLNESTKHTLSTREFEKMKNGVVIVNTGRGGLIDEAALVAALESGKVYAAGLDVFEEEPKIHPGLVGNDKVFLTPHLGARTFEAQTAMETLMLDNLRLSLTEDKMLTQVVEQQSNMVEGKVDKVKMQPLPQRII